MRWHEEVFCLGCMVHISLSSSAHMFEAEHFHLTLLLIYFSHFMGVHVFSCMCVCVYVCMCVCVCVLHCGELMKALPYPSHLTIPPSPFSYAAVYGTRKLLKPPPFLAACRELSFSDEFTSASVQP